jgi:hypothetical protein
MKKKGVAVRDVVGNSILKDERLTLMKYRMNKIKEKKIKENEDIQKINLLTCRLHQRLYSLQEESESFEERYK